METVYGNFMRVDGRMLTAADGEQLEELLTTHKQFVIAKIEALEAKMRANNPNLLIQPPRM